MLFAPIGGGPTIGGEDAARIVRDLCPRLVVPMHYRTAAVGFLEPPDAFLAALGADVEEVAVPDAELDDPVAGELRVLLLAPPMTWATSVRSCLVPGRL